jgi:hypothetical protein
MRDEFEGSTIELNVSQAPLNFSNEQWQGKIVSRAKIAKDAKIEFNKKRGLGGGLCELGVLGARNFLAVAWCNISGVRI